MNRREFITTAAAATLIRPETQETMTDAHVHVFTSNPSFPYATGAHPPDIDASAEALLALMQANGVDRTVLIQVIHYRWDNTYLADVLRRYPRQFKGVCRVNPEDPAAPDQLSRLTEVQGFHGLRLSPAATPEGDWIKGPRMPKLWRRCEQLKVPMTLLIPASRLPDIHPLIEANPDLTLVIDHMADTPLADPQAEQNLLTLARYPKVFTKLSHLWTISKQPYPYSDTKPRVQALLKAFGPDRLMASTDWPVSLPFLTYAQAIDLYRTHLDLTPRQRTQILTRTVRRIWPF
jgi:predicted TIM-barrel fold metal-dependent hydrolase